MLQSNNRLDFIHLMTKKGYFCEWCQEYHAEPKHRLTVECYGEYNGLNGCIVKDEILCPECNRDDMTPFEPMEWTPLKAYLEKNPMNVTFIYPTYDSEDDPFPSAWFETTSVEVVEKAAGRLCVEVLDISYHNSADEIRVKVEIV